MHKMAEDINVDVDFLISLVEARPVLWDKTKEEYKDKNLKTEGWKDVCRNIFPSFDDKDNKEKTKLGNDVVKKWTHIKDNFIKYMKKVELSKKSGAGATHIKEYHLRKQLMFLHKNAPNLTDASIEEEESENPKTRSRYQPYSAATRKRKPSTDEFERQILETLAAPENRHMSFFKSILPSLNKLNDQETLIFQSGVLKILTELYQPPCQPSGYRAAYDANYQQAARPLRGQTPYETNYQSPYNSSTPGLNRRQPSPSIFDLEQILSNSDTQESEYDFT